MADQQTNKTALSNALADINAKGGGVLIIPPGVHYGFSHGDKSSHPDLLNTTTDILILDHSPGEYHEGQPDVTRQGENLRYWFHTRDSIADNHEPGKPTVHNDKTESNGAHNGNGISIFSHWAPYIFISNNLNLDETKNPRIAPYNKRAFVHFGADGKVNWSVGQGSYSRVSDETDILLTDFVITGYLARIPGGENMFVISRDKGFLGFGSGSRPPQYEFHFCIGNQEPYLPGDNVFCIEALREKDVSILLKGTFRNEERKRTIGMQIDTQEFFVTDPTGKSRVFVLDGRGNAEFSAGVSGAAFDSNRRPVSTDGCPISVGTMIFDKTHGKPIWFRGDGNWVDATGRVVEGNTGEDC
jgi:hypothetical protein